MSCECNSCRFSESVKNTIQAERYEVYCTRNIPYLKKYFESHYKNRSVGFIGFTDIITHALILKKTPKWCPKEQSK